MLAGDPQWVADHAPETPEDVVGQYPRNWVTAGVGSSYALTGTDSPLTDEAIRFTTEQAAQDWVAANRGELDGEFVVHNLGTRYFVTELTIRVLSEDQPFHGSLGDLVSAVTEGPCVGDLVSERSYEVPTATVAQLLTEAGSDPAFFDLEHTGPRQATPPPPSPPPGTTATTPPAAHRGRHL